MEVTSEVAETRSIRKEMKHRVEVQMVKVLALATVLLFLLLYLLYATLPQILPTRSLRFLFSVYRLSEPMGVSLAGDGTFYVSEPVKNRILAFDGNGDLIRRVNSTKGKGQVNAVYGSAIDEKRGEIYFADFNLRKIHVFSKEGKFLRSFPKNPFDSSFGDNGLVPLDVDIYNDRAYVATRNGIVVFSRKGSIKEIWGRRRGKGYGSFDFPNGIAINKETGDIFVADTLNRRVVALTNKGKVKWVVGKPDKEAELNSSFSLPRNVALNERGQIFITDAFEHHVVVLNPNGQLRAILGERGVEDGKFNFPEGIAINGNRLIVADKGNARVQVFTIGYDYPEAPKNEVRRFKANISKKTKKKYIGNAKPIMFNKGKPLPGQKI